MHFRKENDAIFSPKDKEERTQRGSQDVKYKKEFQSQISWRNPD